MKIIKADWFDQLVEEIDATLTESYFVSRRALIEGYHITGELLRKTANEKDIKITELIQNTSRLLGMSERKLWYTVKFYDKFPTLDALPPEDNNKNLSWSKIRKNYLTEGEEETEERKKRETVTCPKCGHEWGGD